MEKLKIRVMRTFLNFHRFDLQAIIFESLWCYISKQRLNSFSDSCGLCNFCYHITRASKKSREKSNFQNDFTGNLSRLGAKFSFPDPANCLKIQIFIY